MDRRQALKLLEAAALGLCASAVLPRGRAARASTAGATDRPRFFIQIIPSGGPDPIYTSDPKERAEVEHDVDVPYPHKAIVEAGGLRLGPSFAALKKWAPRIAVINSICQNSANHSSGMAHTTRCKSRTSPETPTLFDLLGSRRQGEALGAVNFSTFHNSEFSSKYLGEASGPRFSSVRVPGLFDHLDAAEPEDLDRAAKSLRATAASLGKAPVGETAMTRDNLLETAELFGRCASGPKFAPEAWDNPFEGGARTDRDLQRALWMFENRLARCAVVNMTPQWFDTHFENARDQPPLTEYLAAVLDRLFAALDRRTFAGRPLAEQTVVIVGSEIGRFPRLNRALGKDHFPQVSYLLYGRWFATGRAYGETDRDMVTQPVSLRTGRPERGGHMLQLDDLGRTLLDLDGADPELFGYQGSHLSFLTA